MFENLRLRRYTTDTGQYIYIYHNVRTEVLVDTRPHTTGSLRSGHRPPLHKPNYDTVRSVAPAMSPTLPSQVALGTIAKQTHQWYWPPQQDLDTPAIYYGFDICVSTNFEPELPFCKSNEPDSLLLASTSPRESNHQPGIKGLARGSCRILK